MLVSKIENGIVVNIVIADSVEWCNENLEGTYVDSANGVGQIGVEWDGSNFVIPEEEPEPAPGESGELPVPEE